MQGLSGVLFVAAWVLAVILGGQTVDYSWGPALVMLAASALLSLSCLRQLRDRGGIAWTCIALLALAWGWIFYGCAHSPVKEFARSDALLAGGMVLCFLYGLLLPPHGRAARLFMGGLSLLAIANGVEVLIQISDKSFAWPFASRISAFPSGFFSHYNHLADFAAAVAGLLGARAILSRDSVGERILQGVAVVFCVICVYFSKSRGGLVGLAAAAEMVAIGAFLIALRDRSRYRRVLAIIPFALLILGAVPAVALVSSFNSSRGEKDPNVRDFADNRSRLLMMNVALRLTSVHPLSGGGSRSFGWQKYGMWNSDPRAKDDNLPTDDDFAHNEILQTAVDYGWVGAGLVVVAVMVSGLAGLGGLMAKDEYSRLPRFAADATAVGGLAAMAATLANSNFSFVTHTLPGAMYLGLALAFAVPRRTPSPAVYARRLYAAWPVGGVILGGALSLLFMGVAASRAYLLIWPVANSPVSIIDPDGAAEAVHQAAELWPTSTLYDATGKIYQTAAGKTLTRQNDVLPYLQKAEGSYAQASRLYPYTARFPLNRARVLTAIAGSDFAGPAATAAEESFEQALHLQGGMEGLLRVRYYYAQFLIFRWNDLWQRHRRAAEAYQKFLYARELLEQAHEMTEVMMQGSQITDLLDDVDDKIEYLEDAGFGPPVKK